MSTQSEVVNFLSEFTGIDVSKIKPNTLVNNELGVDGDDGIELLESFSNRFGVDISSVNKNYFGGEGFPIFSVMTWPIRVVLGKHAKEPDYSPLTVRTLIESAKNKSWTD